MRPTMPHFATPLTWAMGVSTPPHEGYTGTIDTVPVWSRNKQGFYRFRYRAEITREGQRWVIRVYREQLCAWTRPTSPWDNRPIYSVPDTATTLPAAKAKARLVIREHFTEWDQTESGMLGAPEEYIREHRNAS